jgi:hypothetical protein
MEKSNENENKKVICEIKCLRCGKWFKSGIQFGGTIPFDTSTLIGNKQPCPFCGYLTECNKENMRFEERRSDGFVHHHEGNDTM